MLTGTGIVEKINLDDSWGYIIVKCSEKNKELKKVSELSIRIKLRLRFAERERITALKLKEGDKVEFKALESKHFQDKELNVLEKIDLIDIIVFKKAIIRNEDLLHEDLQRQQNKIINQINKEREGLL